MLYVSITVLKPLRYILLQHQTYQQTRRIFYRTSLKTKILSEDIPVNQDSSILE